MYNNGVLALIWGQNNILTQATLVANISKVLGRRHIYVDLALDPSMPHPLQCQVNCEILQKMNLRLLKK